MAKPPANRARAQAGELLVPICPAKLPPATKMVLLSAFRSGTASRIVLARALRLVSALRSMLDLASALALALELASVFAVVLASMLVLVSGLQSASEWKSGGASMLATWVATELVLESEATKRSAQSAMAEPAR